MGCGLETAQFIVRQVPFLVRAQSDIDVLDYGRLLRMAMGMT